MADINNLSNYLTDVANAIRIKKGTNDAIPAANFDNEIINLTGMPDGIYIQNSVPIKTTTEAFWLDNTSGQGISDLIPTSTNMGKNMIFGDIKSRLINDGLINAFDNSAYQVYVDGYYTSYFLFTNEVEVTGQSYDKRFVIGSNNSPAYGYSYGGHSSSSYGPSTISYTEFLNGSGSQFYQNALYTSYGIGYCPENMYWNNSALYREKDPLDVNEDGVYINVGTNKYVLYQSNVASQSFSKILDSYSMNASAADIYPGKTAIVNNTKITGNMNFYDDNSFIPSTDAVDLPYGYMNNSHIANIQSSEAYKEWVATSTDILGNENVPPVGNYKIYYDRSLTDLSGNYLGANISGTYETREDGIYLNGGYINTGVINNAQGTWEVGGTINSDFTPRSSSNWYDCSCIMGCELTGQQQDFGIIINNSGYVGIGYSMSSTSYSSVNVLDGRYHHYTITVSSDTLKLYVDGQLEVTVSYSASGDVPSTYGIYWNRYSSSTYVRGLFKTFRYYEAVLTAEEVEDNYEFSTSLYGVSGSNDYEQIDYIKFTSGQYIDTGIIPSNHKVEVKFDFEEFGQDEHLFGTSRGYQYYSFTSYRPSYQSAQYCWGVNGWNTFGSSLWSTGRHTLIFNDDEGRVILDNNLIGSCAGTTSTTNLLLGKRDNATFAGKIYYMKVWDKSTGNLLLDLIPVKKANNAVVFYDKVSGEFISNSGSGDFIAGPVLKLQTNLEEIKYQKDTYLTPNNIANGVTILGVTGTLNGGGGSADLKIFVQNIEPSTYDGIWFNGNFTYDNIITDGSISSEPYYNSQLNIIPSNNDYSIYHSITSFGSDIFLFSNNIENNCFKYNLITDTFSIINSIPAFSAEWGVTTIDNNCYLFPTEYNLNAYKYDINNDIYIALNVVRGIDYNIIRGGHPAVIGTDCYLYNYYDGYKYNSITDTFKRINTAPIGAEGLYHSAVYGTDIYSFGGAFNATSPKAAIKYNTLTDTYSWLNNIPTNFNGGAFTVDDNIYLIGGYGNAKSVMTYSINNGTYTIQNSLFDNSFGYGTTAYTAQDRDIVVTGSDYNPNVLQKIVFPVKDYTDNSVIIETGTLSHQTNLIDTDVINGLPFSFDNAYYYTNNAIDANINTYYGNGNNWIQL